MLTINYECRYRDSSAVGRCEAFQQRATLVGRVRNHSRKSERNRLSIANQIETQRLIEIAETLDEQAGIGNSLAECVPGRQLAFSGVWGSLRGVFAAVAARHFTNLFMLLPQAADADIVAGDAIAFGLEQSIALPLSVGGTGKHALADSDLAERLQVLQTLRSRGAASDKPLLVTSYIGGALQKVPSAEQMAAATRDLSVGESLAMEQLCQWLDQNGFVSTTAVQFPGEYAVRGGLIDVFSVDAPNPIRIEWFGDDIDSIRYFDLGSQRSIHAIETVDLTAAGSDSEQSEASAESALVSISEYLPDDTLVVLVDPHDCKLSAESLLATHRGFSAFR